MPVQVKVVKDNSKRLAEAIKLLNSTRVMVGVPMSENARGGGPIGNAALLYIHEHGAPEANIPPRPSLGPGVDSVKPEILKEFKTIGEIYLSGKKKQAERVFDRVGILASSAVKNLIIAGLQPPLKYETVLARIRKRSGSPAFQRRARKAVAANISAGQAPGEGVFRPLIDTGQLLHAITYVVRKT